MQAPSYRLETFRESEGALTLKNTFLLLITPTFGGYRVVVGDIVPCARKYPEGNWV